MQELELVAADCVVKTCATCQSRSSTAESRQRQPVRKRNHNLVIRSLLVTCRVTSSNSIRHQQ
jgi:hypothetical protein